MVIPSRPDAPLLRFTRASAFFRLTRSTIASIDGPTAARLSSSVFAARASVPSASALGASPVVPACKVISSSVFCRMARARSPLYLPFHRSGLRRVGPAYYALCCLLRCGQAALRRPQSRIRDTAQISRGKIDRLPRTPAGFTTPVLDDRGLRDHLLARPTG